MKKITYLTAPVVVLAMIVSGCSQEAPTAANESDGAPKIDAPAVSSENIATSAEQVGEAAGRCCPEGFDFEAGFEHPANRNGDGVVCRKVTPGGTITIDNTTPGDCCFPPDPCGGGTD